MVHDHSTHYYSTQNIFTFISLQYCALLTLSFPLSVCAWGGGGGEGVLVQLICNHVNKCWVAPESNQAFDFTFHFLLHTVTLPSCHSSSQGAKCRSCIPPLEGKVRKRKFFRANILSSCPAALTGTWCLLRSVLAAERWTSEARWKCLESKKLAGKDWLCLALREVRAKESVPKVACKEVIKQVMKAVKTWSKWKSHTTKQSKVLKTQKELPSHPAPSPTQLIHETWLGENTTTTSGGLTYMFR